ncbi:MAG: TAXI family TRAP transporter solute-binding subunit, partial [Geminicoccaceae bacterium]|nr:TAXI family TRAP transporter solute-binding subunit [Geminicoccaceae bacterium]
LVGEFGVDGATALETQLEALRGGQLDALFLMVSTEHPAVGQAMQAGDLRLLDLAEWQEGNNLVRFPFLRVARIPAGTYPGQSEPVDTISAQAVLAGPARLANPIGAAGPGSAAIGELQPLADKNITALNDALASTEQLDPALPSPAVLRPQAKPQAASINPSTSYSVVNLLVILISIFLAYLYFREPPRRREPSLREPARPRAPSGAERASGDPHV